MTNCSLPFTPILSESKQSSKQSHSCSQFNRHLDASLVAARTARYIPVPVGAIRPRMKATRMKTQPCAGLTLKLQTNLLLRRLIHQTFFVGSECLNDQEYAVPFTESNLLTPMCLQFQHQLRLSRSFCVFQRSRSHKQFAPQR